MSVSIIKKYSLTIDKKQEEYSEEILIKLRDELNKMFPISTESKNKKPMLDKWVREGKGYRKNTVKITDASIKKVLESLDTISSKTNYEISDDIGLHVGTVRAVLGYLIEERKVVMRREGHKRKFRLKVIEKINTNEQISKIGTLNGKGLQRGRDKTEFSFRER